MIQFGQQTADLSMLELEVSLFGGNIFGNLVEIHFGLALWGQMDDFDFASPKFDCRPVSMVLFHPEMAFVSLLSGYIVAIHLRSSDQASILWELKLNDVALKLVSFVHLQGIT